MSDTCRRLQSHVAEEGRQALRDDAPAQHHLVSCDVCRAFVERLAAVDRALDALPSYDAPDALVEKLLAREELAGPVPVPIPVPPPGQAGDRSRFTIVALRLGAIAAGLLFVFGIQFLSDSPPPEQMSAARDELGDYAELRLGDDELAERPDRVEALRDGVVVGEGTVGAGSGGGVGGGSPSTPPPPPPPSAPVYARRELPRSGEGRAASDAVSPSESESEPEPRQEPARLAQPKARIASQVDAVSDVSNVSSVEERSDELDPSSTSRELRKNDAGAFALERQLEDKKQASGTSGPMETETEVDAEKEGFELRGGALGNANEDAVGARARQRELSSLTFQEPSGYWSNTYLPSDPLIRFLDARLEELGGQGAGPVRARPHAGVRRVAQPFDAPERSALALYLAADRRAVTERTRLTLQVGLQAMARHATRRPAMNVAVVLDGTEARPLEADHAVAAFVRALNDAAETGDVIRYVVAGSAPEALGVAPEATAGSVSDALRQGISLVAGSEDPNTVLGANLVLVVTGRPLGPEVEALERLAHRSAVGGVPVSAIAVGAGTIASELERLALAGQGSRRLVAQASDARPVVEAELAAASRVVARAVRLRIRLMPGVELVGVMGARRLDAAEAGRVREAEQAIDQRLARNLGITADRGEDEEGIQIVIPSFYAGDSHVVLLDVVADGAGPVADVTARYKDVGSLTNEVARASLTLQRGEIPAAAIEANVVQNVLAFRLSENLERSGDALASGNLEGAAELLTEARHALTRALSDQPELDAPGVRADIELLDDYLALLGTGVTRDTTLREYVSASLRLASLLKLTSRLALD